MIKVARHKGEEAKVAIRNVRRKAKEELDRIVKDGEAGEDDGRPAEKELDDLTHRYVAQSRRARQAQGSRAARGLMSYLDPSADATAAGTGPLPIRTTGRAQGGPRRHAAVRRRARWADVRPDPLPERRSARRARHSGAAPERHDPGGPAPAVDVPGRADPHAARHRRLPDPDAAP